MSETATDIPKCSNVSNRDIIQHASSTSFCVIFSQLHFHERISIGP